MATEASSQGQAAATGGADEKQERQADRRAGEVDHGQAQERVAACLTSAFQAAWSAAAPSTTQKTRGVTLAPLPGGRPPPPCHRPVTDR